MAHQPDPELYGSVFRGLVPERSERVARNDRKGDRGHGARGDLLQHPWQPDLLNRLAPVTPGNIAICFVRSRTHPIFQIYPFVGNRVTRYTFSVFSLKKKKKQIASSSRNIAKSISRFTFFERFGANFCLRNKIHRFFSRREK